MSILALEGGCPLDDVRQLRRRLGSAEGLAEPPQVRAQLVTQLSGRWVALSGVAPKRPVDHLFQRCRGAVSHALHILRPEAQKTVGEHLG